MCDPNFLKGRLLGLTWSCGLRNDEYTHETNKYLFPASIFAFMGFMKFKRVNRIGTAWKTIFIPDFEVALAYIDLPKQLAKIW